MSEIRFPVLDFDRTADEFHSNGRVVIDGAQIEPEIPETGEFATVPVRSIIDSNNGPGFEIGPYSLTESDVVCLFNTLSRHVRGYPDLFKWAAKGGVPSTDFTFYAEPSAIAPGVHLGLGSVSDDSDRLFLSADDVQLTPQAALGVAKEILDLVIKAANE